MSNNEFPQVIDSFDNFLVSACATGAQYSRNSDVFSTYMSCGISMIYGLSGSTAAQIVEKVLKERAITDKKTIKEAFVIFSDTIYGSGNTLYAYIKEQNLGNIVEFGPRMNPNTGNMIKMWVWEPPHESLDPKHRYLPVYGKKLIKDNRGYYAIYIDKDDPRFNNSTREA